MMSKVGKKSKRKIGIPCSRHSALLCCLKFFEHAEWRRRESRRRESEEDMAFLEDENEEENE